MWFLKSIDDVLKELNVDPQNGLGEEEVEKRLKKYGMNRLQEKKKKTILQLFITQLNDTLIYVLFGAVVITLFMREYVDAVIILGVIFINAVLGVLQEVKAGKAVEDLQKITSPKTLVKRDGEIKEIDTKKIVPGDILILEAGKFVSADLRLIESANLRIEESALTGESIPVNKNAKYIHNKPDTHLGDRKNSAYMSTLVIYGRGVGVVVETGMNTEAGKIAGSIETEELPTPLEIRLDELGKTLGKAAIGICILIFIIALFQGRNISEMFLTAVSLAVASIPEGLAAIVAVVLSIGVTIMSKKNVIIKRLPAVETLGSVNIVCTDKTGTLTQNKMTAVKIFTLTEGILSVDEINKNNLKEDISLLAKTMILCSDATYEHDNATGDPTEIALLILGDKLGINRKILNKINKRINELPFDSDRKLMSTLTKDENKFIVNTKGAIDNLIQRCTHVYENGEAVLVSDNHKKQILDAVENMAVKSLRTLAAAYKPVDFEADSSEMEKDLIFIGVVGMIDPPRDEVKSSIRKAKSAGITTIMITGDHKNTAFTIAKDLEIAEDIKQVVTGAEVENLEDEKFAKNINNLKVFARVLPQHKVKIVKGFKSGGNIVSMTGDGVNDAPSLSAADIGVAMGITGTDAAKSAADMILTDDNFATIITAIEQGRNIYNNIKKSVIFLLTCNLGEVITMFVSVFIGMPVPLIATQLLWINLLTDSLPAVALGMDPGDSDVMKEKPRNPKESFFAHGAGYRAITGGLLIGAITIFAFWFGFYEKGFSPFGDVIPNNVIEYARTIAFMTIISSQLFYSLGFRSSIKSIFQTGIFSNKYLAGAIMIGLLLQFLVIGIPVMQDAFKLQMPDSTAWINIFILGLLPLTVNEIVKIFLRKKK